MRLFFLSIAKLVYTSHVSGSSNRNMFPTITCKSLSPYPEPHSNLLQCCAIVPAEEHGCNNLACF